MSNDLYFYFFDVAIDSFHKQNKNSRKYVASFFGCTVVGVAAWVLHVLLWPCAHQNVEISMKDLGLNFSWMRLSAQKVITRFTLLFVRSSRWMYTTMYAFNFHFYNILLNPPLINLCRLLEFVLALMLSWSL